MTARLLTTSTFYVAWLLRVLRGACNEGRGLLRAFPFDPEVHRVVRASEASAVVVPVA